MIPTLCLLTASCVSAAEPPGAANCNCGPATPQQPGVAYYDNGVGKNLRSRVRNFLGMYPQSSPYPTLYGGQPIPVVTSYAPAQTAPPPALNLPLTKKAE